NPKRGWPEPLIGVYGARCLPLLDGAIAAGELAIWRIFERVQVHHLEVSPEEAEQLLNLNTPGDLTQLGT
ncbi:MAG: molybdenum cofactor guanylyltransferase, partial [Phycisphaerae bacterium]|nr:molybdenum cofactor guanylyltransferase [Phycisphaerae bacterium]